MIAAWESVLSCKGIGMEDNFFDLGGHSLLAAKLLSRVEREFGVRLSMAQVFQAPTVRQFSNLLVSGDERARSPKVLPIQSAGSHAPLFWINAGPKLRALASRLGNRRPFLGVTSSPEEQAALPGSFRLEELAACLVRTIRDVQAEGPYFLGGWCASGLLAYEVAVQLRAAGQQVAQLFLLDTLNPVHFKEIPRWRILASRARLHAQNILGRPAAESWSYIRSRMKARMEEFNPPEGAEQHQWNLRVYSAAHRYRPPAYSGHLTLIQPAEGLDVAGMEDSWSGVPCRVREVYRVAGNHDTALDEPSVHDLAGRIASCLAEAETHGQESKAASFSPRAAGASK